MPIWAKDSIVQTYSCTYIIGYINGINNFYDDQTKIFDFGSISHMHHSSISNANVTPYKIQLFAMFDAEGVEYVDPPHGYSIWQDVTSNFLLEPNFDVNSSYIKFKVINAEAYLNRLVNFKIKITYKYVPDAWYKE